MITTATINTTFTRNTTRIRTIITILTVTRNHSVYTRNKIQTVIQEIASIQ